jgi:hypothetical protein
LDVKLLTSHDSQQLCSCREAAGLLEERYRFGEHSESMARYAALTSHPGDESAEQTQNRTRDVRAMRFCVCSR